MVVQLRPRTIVVDRGSRGFGLSLIYRGLDKYEEKDTGIFVARVVPGGQRYTDAHMRFAHFSTDSVFALQVRLPDAASARTTRS